MPEVVPLSVDDFKELEGFDAADPALKTYVDLLNDKELSPKDRGVKLIELQKQVMQSLSEKSTQAFVELQGKWQDEVRNDPEFSGGKLEPALGGIAKLLTRFGDEKTKEAFDYTGAGNHPAIVRFLHKVSSVLNEPGPDPTRVDPPVLPKTQHRRCLENNLK